MRTKPKTRFCNYITIRVYALPRQWRLKEVNANKIFKKNCFACFPLPRGVCMRVCYSYIIFTSYDKRVFYDGDTE